MSVTCAGLLALLGAVGCGGTDEGIGGADGTGGAAGAEGSGSPGAISERAFAITAHVELSESEAPRIGNCGDFQFTGRFRKLNSQWVFEAASAGDVVQTTLDEAGPGSYAAVTSDGSSGTVLELPDRCFHVHDLAQLTFVGSDDVAGAFTRFSAHGSGNRYTSCGDCSYDEEEALTLVGSPDTEPPSLTLPASELDPLDATPIEISEALLDAQATVTSPAGDARTVLVQSSSEEATWSFEVPPLLALGTSFEWRADGRDWAGNLLESRRELRTLADTGVLAPDGFESDVVALRLQTSELVEDGALDGTRSLRVQRYRRATFHLQHAGATKLVFQCQPLPVDLSYLADDEEVLLSFVEVRYGTLGGTQVQTHELSVAESVLRQGTPVAPATVELKLAEPGDDVVVSFDLPEEDEDCGLIACADVSSLIDDLRLE
jgi:hypothetical protein